MNTVSEHALLAVGGVHLVAATAGTASFLLIWLATLSGIVLRNGWVGIRIRHSSLLSLHMIGATTGLALGILHGFAQLAAPVQKVQPVDLVLPFGNPFDRVGIGVGVLATELMLAASLGVALQRRLGVARWRLLHNLNHVAFMLLVGHILISGSDVGPAPVWMTVVGSWVVVVLFWAAGGMSTRAGRRPGRPATAGRGQPDIHVGVDVAACLRFGFCEHEAPGVFQLHSDGRLAHRSYVSADRADDVLRAATACPVRAITVRPTAGQRLSPPPPPAQEAPEPGRVVPLRDRGQGRSPR